MDKMDETLQTIKAHATTLNEAADEASDQVRDVETFLREAGAGVPCDVCITLAPNCLLCYHRMQSQYCITIVEGEDERAWRACRREMKLVAFPFLGQLVERLATVMEQEISATVVARAQRKELMSLVSPPRKLSDE
jgi:hypothetical protein